MGSEMCIRDRDDSSDESSTESSGCARTLGATRRATSPTAPDRPGRFPVVTRVPVDTSYNFPRTELAAMTTNIAGLIDDIDRLDKHRRNMMEELQVLRDVTLFYNERHPELRSAVRKPPTEDPDTGGKADNRTPARPATDDKDERAGQTPTPIPAATKEESPGPAAAGDTPDKGEQ